MAETNVVRVISILVANTMTAILSPVLFTTNEIGRDCGSFRQRQP